MLALGGVSNSFNTLGAEEHCIFLDSLENANLFHHKLLDALLQLNETQERVSIGIVGAGATGVELAAELHHVIESVKEYGYLNISKNHLDVHLIEASPKILPNYLNVLAQGRRLFWIKLVYVYILVCKLKK